VLHTKEISPSLISSIEGSNPSLSTFAVTVA
jgi:hypothetical protein